MFHSGTTVEEMLAALERQANAITYIFTTNEGEPTK